MAASKKMWDQSPSALQISWGHSVLEAGQEMSSGLELLLHYLLIMTSVFMTSVVHNFPFQLCADLQEVSAASSCCFLWK